MHTKSENEGIITIDVGQAQGFWSLNAQFWAAPLFWVTIYQLHSSWSETLLHSALLIAVAVLLFG